MVTRHVRTVGAFASAVALIAGVSACGSSASSSTAVTAAATPPVASSARGGGRLPATAGMIAAISGTTLQVQNATAQTAVTYTASTAFTLITTVDLAAVRTGECATAVGVVSGATLTARTVRLTPSTGSGTCTARAGRGGGFAGAGGRRRAGRAGAEAVTGQVTSVSATGLVITGTVRTRRAAGTAPTAAGATPISVTLAATGTITQVAGSSPQALAVGLCVVAVGPTGSTGTVAARSIALSHPVNGACAPRFAGRAFGGGSNGSTGA